MFDKVLADLLINMVLVNMHDDAIMSLAFISLGGQVNVVDAGFHRLGFFHFVRSPLFSLLALNQTLPFMTKIRCFIGLILCIRRLTSNVASD